MGGVSCAKKDERDRRKALQKPLGMDGRKESFAAATQWADGVNAPGAAIEREAGRRLDELLATATRLIASGVDEAPQIRADLASLNSARDEIRRAKSHEVAR